MIKQLSNRIVCGASFIVTVLREEDLVKEAVITLVVLAFLVVVLQ
jgi:hypothetical protein